MLLGAEFGNSGGRGGVLVGVGTGGEGDWSANWFFCWCCGVRLDSGWILAFYAGESWRCEIELLEPALFRAHGETGFAIEGEHVFRRQFPLGRPLSPGSLTYIVAVHARGHEAVRCLAAHCWKGERG